MPGTVELEKLTTAPGSDLRQLEIQHNNAIQDIQNLMFGGSLDLVLGWNTLASNSLQALGRGSTDTDIASGALTGSIKGVPFAKAAVTTGTAISAQTIPADKWGIYSLDIVANGTITVTAGAANATTGYATEAAAIAALPPRVTAKARMGYITVLTADGEDWIAATDGLAGGASGNPASETNYYPVDGVCAPTGVAYGPNGVVTCGGAPVVTSDGEIAGVGTGVAWTGGRNGVLITPGLSIGSTDTDVANLAFTFNCNGAAGIAKAAVTAGTAPGALGTVPAGRWGILVLIIDGAGTVTYLSGPANYTTGYQTEDMAKADLYKIFPTFTATAQKTMMGYVTVKAQSGEDWIVGTDAFAGGTSGNEAAATNYYSVQGITIPTGGIASKLASRTGAVLSSAQY